MQNNIFPGLFVGQNLVRLKEVDSTNNFLKSMVSNSKPVAEGTVIMAEHQFAGRGQRQNGWFTEPGSNLTFSILLKPHFLTPDKQFYLSKAVSVSVVKALQNVAGDGFKIKWPNDIYFGSKKLGGILIENMLQGRNIANCIIGIGINVNQAEFPAHLPNAVSLEQILQKDYDVAALLSDICSHVEAGYLRLKRGDLEAVELDYHENLFGLNELLNFKSNEKEFKGTIKEVLPNGKLKIDTLAGSELYDIKEIEFLLN